MITLTEALDSLPQLTQRQRSVVMLVVQGHTYASIGQTLCLSPRTVKLHAHEAQRALGCRSSRDVVRLVWGRLTLSRVDCI